MQIKAKKYVLLFKIQTVKVGRKYVNKYTLVHLLEQMQIKAKKYVLLFKIQTVKVERKYVSKYTLVHLLEQMQIKAKKYVLLFKIQTVKVERKYAKQFNLVHSTPMKRKDKEGNLTLLKSLVINNQYPLNRYTEEVEQEISRLTVIDSESLLGFETFPNLVF
ncbi:Arylsulfatase J [Armadillidium vulgare]|nr:Arylsulfatase J [Armadillidium vulgare]